MNRCIPLYGSIGKVHPLFEAQVTTRLKERPEGVRLRRGVADLYRRAQVSHQANYRYLEALASVTGTTPLREQATGVCQAVRYRGRRYRRLNPLAQADYQLLQAVSRAEFTLTGMRNADPGKPHIQLTFSALFRNSRLIQARARRRSRYALARPGQV